MACNCLANLNTHLEPHNTRVCEAFVPGMIDPVVVIQFEQISTDSNEACVVSPNYCPFCGVRYGMDPALGQLIGGAEAATHVH